MRWRRGQVLVERVGGALWIEADDRGLLVDAPPGTASALGDRLAHLDAVLLTTGRLERVAGLISVLGALPARPRPEPLTVWFPLSDERGALLVEAWQRAWPDREVTLDGIGPGEPIELPIGHAEAAALADAEGGMPPLGVRIGIGDARIGVLPRCRLDGAVRRLARGVDLLVVETGGSGLSAREAVELAGRAELWIDGVAEA